MPTKEKWFHSVKFRPEDLKEATAKFLGEVPSDSKGNKNSSFSVCSGDTTWTFEDADQFYSEYRQASTTSARFSPCESSEQLVVYYFGPHSTSITVKLPSRPQVERVFEVFEAARQICAVPSPRPCPRIFIGHGRHAGWRDLKDHLHEKHGLDVTAYETGARAGYSITEFLEQSQDDAGFALLVHSAEDEDSSGGLHARENVIHETGLFQGHLGFRRAIVLREEGCQEFSNLAGVQEIRFSKANIRETFGEVLATLRREFDDGGEPS